MKIKVMVHPSSKKPRVEKDMLEMIHVYVDKPAIEGEANKAAIKLLVGYLGVKKNRVRIVSGFTSRLKVIEVDKN